MPLMITRREIVLFHLVEPLPLIWHLDMDPISHPFYLPSMITREIIFLFHLAPLSLVKCVTLCINYNKGCNLFIPSGIGSCTMCVAYASC